jgi:Rps23 Pro-64 3,4-dihydroxylase Tpa1-like proline 4-hydroxylase
MHFAIYPAGTFYKRHANHFNQQAHRYMTFVFTSTINGFRVIVAIW